MTATSTGWEPGGAHPQRAESPRLLLVRSSLGLDGGAMRFLAWATAARERGGEARILTPPGPLAERAAKADVLELVDWPNRPVAEALALLERAAKGKTAVVTCCLPTNLPMVPALALHAPVHLCVHATPASLAEAFGEDTLPALGSVLQTLQRSGRVLLTAASELEAREHERRLDLPLGALVAFPHGVEEPEEEGPAKAGPIETVALVSRLERIKLPHVIAAAQLVSAGRSTGTHVRLEVHGDGSARAEAISVLEAALPPSAWTMHGATSDPLAVMRRADVIVGGGRTCFEALSVGRRAAVALAARPESARILDISAGHLGPPVTPTTLDVHVAANFNAIEQPAVSATDVWRALESLSPQDVARMQERVRSTYSADAMLTRQLDLLRDLSQRPQRRDQLLRAGLYYAAQLEKEVAHERSLRDRAERLHRRAEAELARLHSSGEIRQQELAQLRSARRSAEEKLARLRSSQARREARQRRQLQVARKHLDRAAESRAWRLSQRAALVVGLFTGRRFTASEGLERARDLVDRVVASSRESAPASPAAIRGAMALPHGASPPPRRTKRGPTARLGHVLDHLRWTLARAVPRRFTDPLTRLIPSVFLHPVMSKAELKLLTRHAQGAGAVVEFGAGGTTLYFARRAARLYSVESDLAFHRFISSLRPIKKRLGRRVALSHVDIGATGEWGFPIDDTHKDRWANYCRDVWELIEANTRVGLVLIDGRFRVMCALTSIERARARGWDPIILIHDFWNRPSYHVLLQYLDVVDKADTLGVFKIKDNVDLRAVDETMKRYEYVPA